MREEIRKKGGEGEGEGGVVLTVSSESGFFTGPQVTRRVILPQQHSQRSSLPNEPELEIQHRHALPKLLPPRQRPNNPTHDKPPQNPQRHGNKAVKTNLKDKRPRVLVEVVLVVVVELAREAEGVEDRHVPG